MGYFAQRQSNFKWYVKQGKANTYYNSTEINSYPEFLKSDFWKATKFRFLKGRTTCYMCKKTKSVDVHHITYRGMFKPDLGQLLALCRDCHFYLHSFPFSHRDRLRAINRIIKGRRG